MSGQHRTPRGGRIDRARPLRFTFDGHAYEGCHGDTLASALLAHGVHLVGRSFKYHRPRGFLAAGAEEPNALCTVKRDRARTTPNLRMTQVELYEGLVATSQNAWPARGFDVGAVNDLLSPLLGAGFYYKTFMGPRAIKGATLWAKLFEPVIRRAAGLGVPPTEPDPDHYANRFVHCDVLVVGGGPAGLAAALAAARAGKRTLICDENPEMGGALLCQPAAEVDGRPAADWVAAAVGRARPPRRHRAAAHAGLRLLQPQFRGADRAPDRPPPARPRGRPPRKAVAGAGRARRAGHGRDRAAPGLPGQRPARDHAGRRGPGRPAPLGGEARHGGRGGHGA